MWKCFFPKVKMNAPKTDMAECGSQVAGPPSMDVWCGPQSERYHGTSCCVGGNAGLGSALRDIETESTKKWLAHWLWLPDADGVSLSSESGLCCYGCKLKQQLPGGHGGRGSAVLPLTGSVVPHWGPQAQLYTM